MNKFIGLNIATLDDNGKIQRTGNVLINVDHIVSIESQGKPCADSVCKVRTLHDALPFIVEGSMIDLLEVIKRAGAEFHAFDNSKKASQQMSQRLKHKGATCIS